MEKKIKHYIELMRLDQPIGTYLVLWPALWSIAFADPEFEQIWLYFVFITGAIIARSAGCIVNDIIDRKLDAKVERTKNRPIACGNITVNSALILLSLLTLLGMALLLTLSSTALIMGVSMIIPVMLYPFMKRITYWPQAFLGLTINWGALMGWAAVRDSVGIPAILLYIGAFFWTLGYDTIYSHQDKLDDLNIGIKSTALKLGSRTKQYLVLFYTLAIFFFWLVGTLLQANFWYHITLLAAVIHFVWQILYVDIDDPKKCARVFKSNGYFGLIIFLGALIGSSL